MKGIDIDTRESKIDRKLYKLRCNFIKILGLQIFFPFNKSSYYNHNS